MPGSYPEFDKRQTTYGQLRRSKRKVQAPPDRPPSREQVMQRAGPVHLPRGFHPAPEETALNRTLDRAYGGPLRLRPEYADPCAKKERGSLLLPPRGRNPPLGDRSEWRIQRRLDAPQPRSDGQGARHVYRIEDGDPVP